MNLGLVPFMLICTYLSTFDGLGFVVTGQPSQVIAVELGDAGREVGEWEGRGKLGGGG